MKSVIRLVSAIGAGASLIWGVARAMRRSAGDSDDGPTWPPAGGETPPSTGGAAKPDKEMPPKAAQPESETVTTVHVGDAAPATKAETKPQTKAAPAAEAAPTDEPLVLKGVTVDEPDRFLAFVNSATEESLRDAGIKGKAVTLLLEGAPFASANDVGSTSGIGRRTLQSLLDASAA